MKSLHQGVGRLSTDQWASSVCHWKTNDLVSKLMEADYRVSALWHSLRWTALWGTLIRPGVTHTFISLAMDKSLGRFIVFQTKQTQCFWKSVTLSRLFLFNPQLYFNLCFMAEYETEPSSQERRGQWGNKHHSGRGNQFGPSGSDLPEKTCTILFPGTISLSWLKQGQPILLNSPEAGSLVSSCQKGPGLWDLKGRSLSLSSL